MSGYLGGDHCSINAQAIVDDQIALAISLLPSGEGTTHCLECGLAIPPVRRSNTGRVQDRTITARRKE